VEDEEAVRAFAGRALEARGYKVSRLRRVRKRWNSFPASPNRSIS